MTRAEDLARYGVAHHSPEALEELDQRGVVARMSLRPESDRIACYDCNRGGRGNDKDKCSCGWRVTTPGPYGCYLGTPIVGAPNDPPPEPKMTRSQKRYREYKDAAEWFNGTFAEWCGMDKDSVCRRFYRGVTHE